MIIVIAVLAIALLALTISWGSQIDADVTGRIEAARPPIQRVA